MKFLISLGIPIRNPKISQYGKRYNGALLQIIDWESKSVHREIEYRQPDPSKWPDVSHLFKGAHLTANECWVVTNNEIVIFDRTSWAQIRSITHPTFNDLHSVLPYKEGYYVCNTGLEIIQHFDANDNLLESINIATTPTGDRFDLQGDYRNIPSTKPHEVHPNYVFARNDELWVSRCLQQDCTKLYDPTVKSARLPGPCHDGLVVGDRTYFTTVNGHICAISNETNRVVLDINLNTPNSLHMNVGWVRGICIRNGSAFIGNTAMRESKAVEFGKWIKRQAGRNTTMGSAIVEVDLESREVVDIYIVKDNPGAAIYSIISI